MSIKLSRYIASFSELPSKGRSFIGGKAFNLIKLKNNNCLVPKSFVINISAHKYFIKNGTLPDGLIKEILSIKKSFGNKIIIRSSANCEDGENLSMAGIFLSQYVYEDSQINQAIKQIYNQSQSKEVDNFLALHNKSIKEVRMGIIVQQLIEPDFSGVIYTGVNNNEILVEYIDGLGSKLVDGEVVGSSFLLRRDGIITESISFELRPLSKKIINLILKSVKEVEAVFPKKPQDIEFACKNDEVYILQARTLTTDLGKVELRQSVAGSLEETKQRIKWFVSQEKQEMGIKTAIFSNSNYSELLPKPAPMDIGVYQYISGGSNGIVGATQIGRLEMGYKLGKEATGIIHYLGGRTYFSIARNAAIYHIGFPETKEEYFQTLVNEYLDKVDKDPENGAYPQMGLYLQDPTLDDLRKRYGDKADEYFAVYRNFTSKMQLLASSFLDQFQNNELPEIKTFIKEMSAVKIKNFSNKELADQAIKILEHIRTKTYVNFVKAARLGFYYSQRLRSLFSDEIYAQLNQGLEGSAITESNIAIALAPTESEAVSIAKEKIGHFSTGEMLEIRHLPLRDDARKLLIYVRGIRQIGSYVTDFEKQKQTRLIVQQKLLKDFVGSDKKELEDIIFSSQTYMALRETIKYLFTKEYLLLRDILELLEERFSLEKGNIYYLYPRELASFVIDQEAMNHLILARKQFFENVEYFDLPSVIREQDIDNLSLIDEKNNDFTEAIGKFLANGKKIEGVIVNIDEFTDLEEINSTIQKYKQDNKRVILVATQMNLSHDPLIIQVDGLVIENAGIVAHGAQRARELGKGAIGGIRSRLLKTGIEIIFDPQKKSIRKVN